jgi:hypothetical protein
MKANIVESHVMSPTTPGAQPMLIELGDVNQIRQQDQMFDEPAIDPPIAVVAEEHRIADEEEESSEAESSDEDEDEEDEEEEEEVSNSNHQQPPQEMRNIEQEDDEESDDDSDDDSEEGQPDAMKGFQVDGIQSEGVSKVAEAQNVDPLADLLSFDPNQYAAEPQQALPLYTSTAEQSPFFTQNNPYSTSDRQEEINSESIPGRDEIIVGANQPTESLVSHEFQATNDTPAKAETITNSEEQQFLEKSPIDLVLEEKERARQQKRLAEEELKKKFNWLENKGLVNKAKLIFNESENADGGSSPVLSSPSRSKIPPPPP